MRKEKLTLLLLVTIFCSCETMKQNKDWDSPQALTPSQTGEMSDDARETGNSLFGAVDQLSRMPDGVTFARAIQPSVSGAGCAEAIARKRGPAIGADPKYTVSLKNYPKPRHGCIPYTSIRDKDTTIDKILASQNLRAVNSTKRERRTMAAAIARVQELNGGPLKTGMGPTVNGKAYPFVFKDANGSSQRGGQINIGRNKAKRGDHHHGHSVGQHAHEWAHLIGNNGAYGMFRKYMADNKSYGSKNYCKISNYSDDNPNEQFAEVFTAFVTDPSSLLTNSRDPNNCKKAFNFFRDVFFKNGKKVESCIPHPLRL